MLPTKTLLKKLMAKFSGVESGPNRTWTIWLALATFFAPSCSGNGDTIMPPDAPVSIIRYASPPTQLLRYPTAKVTSRQDRKRSAVDWRSSALACYTFSFSAWWLLTNLFILCPSIICIFNIVKSRDIWLYIYEWRIIQNIYSAYF